jgi:hypothetical protein
MRGKEQVVSMGQMRNAYEVLAGKSDEKRPLEIPEHRQEDNIKTILKIVLPVIILSVINIIYIFTSFLIFLYFI